MYIYLPAQIIIHRKLRRRSQAFLSESYIALEEGCRWVPKKASYVSSGYVEPFLAKDKSKTFDSFDFISFFAFSLLSCQLNSSCGISVKLVLSLD